MPKKQRKDWERIFEDHFCHQLDTKWRYRIFRDSEITVDKKKLHPLGQVRTVLGRYPTPHPTSRKIGIGL